MLERIQIFVKQYGCIWKFFSYKNLSGRQNDEKYKMINKTKYGIGDLQNQQFDPSNSDLSIPKIIQKIQKY
jgi:hypothetical protein